MSEYLKRRAGSILHIRFSLIVIHLITPDHILSTTVFLSHNVRIERQRLGVPPLDAFGGGMFQRSPPCA